MRSSIAMGPVVRGIIGSKTRDKKKLLAEFETYIEEVKKGN